MPVPRLQTRAEQAKYIVVERTEEDKAQEVESSRATATATATPTTFVSPRQDHTQPHPTVLQTRDDDDSDEDWQPSVWTLTVMGGAQPTGGALAASDPTATVVVAIPPPPRDGDGDGRPGGRPHQGGISQTTEHLLIAAGSIGATIILAMIVLAIYTMRKRGLSLTQAIKQGKYQVTRRGPPPPPKYQPSWDAKQSFSNDYGSLRRNTVTPPQAAMARSGSFSSQRPLMALGRSDSFNLQNAKPLDGQRSTFLLESPPPPRRNNSHRRGPSITPSSAVLGQDSRRSVSTHNTRSVDEDASELVYNDISQDRAVSPLPPPPTFKQFLNNRPSISGKAGFGGMMSRFSWTNSNAPQTPKATIQQDVYQGSRESYMTSRSSVPRFRTVDSWVNQQTNRIEAQKLKEQFRLTSTSTVYSIDEEADRVPEVPAMPKNVERLRVSSAPMSASLPLRAPATPPLPASMGLPGKNIKHERQDTRTTVDTAPIFRQHPGNEVRFSTRSTVPSEILDRGRPNNVLS
ncbi:hypothetical protein P171DRAFT_119229 [Karstenula rhodostoma CBS 690.94]|uniref:Uncharacterized protein n=1 Tax=Karstenula rhodostoma CBS 690.94 TaxID=1392251 RepID=A0A9P4P9V3_9PLEO|nr:hypothetical protein P171DRAFT_119229 [Karstenula rhodostoma CBS 690.94]